MEELREVPHHVGIIVDGNGRWATTKGKSRSAGHKAGANNLKKIIKHVFKKNIKVLSAFIFSTENHKRSKEEVDYLMELFIFFFKNEFKEFKKENIKIVFSGRKDGLKKDVVAAMENVEKETINNTKGILNFCMNYGGRLEISDAFHKIYQDIQTNNIRLEEVNENLIMNYLYQPLPNLDLVIRTSGEMRISNFMLYQASYAEFVFVNTYFPDFNENEFDLVLEEYRKRDRRFGGNSKKDN